MAQDRSLLTLVTHHRRLVDAVGRTAHCNLHLCRMVEYFLRHLLYFRRHRGREHKRLARVGRLGHYLHYVVVEPHVEHAVGFVEDKHLHLAQIHIPHAHVRKQTPRGGYHHICTHFQPPLLLRERGSVRASVDGHRVYRQEIGETLHLAVYLLRELAGGRHYYTIDGIRLGLGGETVDDGQQIGCSLAGTGLRYCYEVAPFEHSRNGLFLNRSAFAEVHGVKSVKNIVTEV